MSTRNFSLLNIIELPSEEDVILKGAKLPSYRQTLLCYLAIQKFQSGMMTERDAAKNVAEPIINIYTKARIPTKSTEGIIKQIIEFKKVYRSCTKIPVQRRNGN